MTTVKYGYKDIHRDQTTDLRTHQPVCLSITTHSTTSKRVRHYLLFSSSSSSRTLSKALLRSTATGLVLRDLIGDRVRLRRFDRLGVGVRLLCLSKRIRGIYEAPLKLLGCQKAHFLYKSCSNRDRLQDPRIKLVIIPQKWENYITPFSHQESDLD